jgi:hypothetical protein
MSANWDALKERVPDSYIKQRKQGGNTLSYVAWYNACDLLDERAPGWSCEIRQVGEIDGKVFMRVAVTVDGVTRENIGYEDEDMKGYGDPFSNSFGMALRRAAALFGIARHLYDKDDRPAPQRVPARVEQVQPVAKIRAAEGEGWACGQALKGTILDLETECQDGGIYKSVRDRLEMEFGTRNPATLSASDAERYKTYLTARLEKAKADAKY